MGIGSSFGFINMLYVVNSNFSYKHFALIAGIGETVSIVIASVCAILLPFLISHFGWRFIILSSGWLGVVLFITASLLARNQQITCSTHYHEVLKSFLILTKEKQLWLLGIYGLCVFSLISVFSSLWGVPFVTHVYHYDINDATHAVMMIPLGIGAGCLFIGFLTTKFKNKQIMLIASITCAVLMSLVIYGPMIHFFLLLLLLFFCGFFSATYIQAYAICKAILFSSFSRKCHGTYHDDYYGWSAYITNPFGVFIA